MSCTRDFHEHETMTVYVWGYIMVRVEGYKAVCRRERNGDGTPELGY